MGKNEPQTLTNDQIKRIGREYGRTKGATELSNELGVSKQRICQIVTKLRQHGLDIPRFRSVDYQRIVDELKKEIDIT